MKTVKILLASMILITSLASCSSNDDNDNTSNECEEFIDQDAKGTVKGFDYTNQGGTYILLSSGKYQCAIRTKQATGGSCAFPEFDPFSNTLLEVKIVFNLDELVTQTITFSDVADEDGNLTNTLNFNAIHYDTTENSTYTDLELATCGTLEITEVSSTEISGKIVAEGQQGSTINGNFTLELCEF
ncbi:MAG: hypothetical protein HRT67_02360 [Flavobacteriaceae bacterium]|nr:hypothetical protein [Flavobacteriaceae bacterium]